MPNIIPLAAWAKKNNIPWARAINHIRAKRLKTAARREYTKIIWTIDEDEEPPT